MNDIERIVEQLEREHAGHPWHGPALTDVLKGLGHQAAAARPFSGSHSIWDIVLHMTAWKNEARHRVEGARAGEPREGDWPSDAERSEQHWNEAIARLDTAHRLLVSAVRSLREENLHVPTNDHRAEGLAPTYYEVLMGILQHDAYHAGQIAILKKGIR